MIDYGHWDVSLVGNFDPSYWFGFIYEIENLITGQKYIGKKQFRQKKSRPPLKGKKRKRIEYVDSNWRKYESSSDLVKQGIQEHGKENFKFVILRLCSGLCELSYTEEKLQFENDVLFKKLSSGLDAYYNNTIAHKNYGGIIKQINETQEKMKDLID